MFLDDLRPWADSGEGRGGGGGRSLPFFLAFLNVFGTLTILYFASRIRPQCCMLRVLKSEVFICGGGGGGTRPPLSEYSGSALGGRPTFVISCMITDRIGLHLVLLPLLSLYI